MAGVDGTRVGLRSPAARLVLALGVAVGVLALVFTHAMGQPWLGLRLRWDEAAKGARVLASEGPAAAIPAGTVIAAVRGAGDPQPRALGGGGFTIEPPAELAQMLKAALAFQH